MVLIVCRKMSNLNRGIYVGLYLLFRLRFCQAEMTQELAFRYILKRNTFTWFELKLHGFSPVRDFVEKTLVGTGVCGAQIKIIYEQCIDYFTIIGQWIAFIIEALQLFEYRIKC